MTNTYVVKSAVYGAMPEAGCMAADVTDALQWYLDNNQTQLCISNGFPSPNQSLTTTYPPFPDPSPMNPKAFGAIVTVNGTKYVYTCFDGATIDFSVPPQPPVSPAWYSWLTRAFSDSNAYPSTVCVDPSGIVYACSWNPGTAPNTTAGGYLVSWQTGEASWTNLGGAFSDVAPQMCADSAGNIYVGGQRTSTGNAILAVYSPASGWNNVDIGLDGVIQYLCADGNGNVYAGGTYVDANGNATVAVYNPGNTTPLTFVACGFTTIALSDLCCDTNGQLYALYTETNDNSAPALAYYTGGEWNTIVSDNLQPASGIGCDNAGNVYFNTASSVMSCAVATSTFTDLQAPLPTLSMVVDFYSIVVDGILYVATYGSTSQTTTSGVVFAYWGGTWQNITPADLSASTSGTAFGLASISSQSIYVATNLNGVSIGSLGS